MDKIFRQTPDELNWDVLASLGWKIVNGEYYNGRQLYEIRDATNRVRGTDEGNPYARAKALGNLPMYSMNATMALTLLEDVEYTIAKRFDKTSQGIQRTVYNITIGADRQYKGYDDLAYAVCQAYLKWRTDAIIQEINNS